MAYTLTDCRARIAELQEAISAATAAQSYGHGNKQVARQDIEALQRLLNNERRSERELVALANGATSPGSLSASWS